MKNNLHYLTCNKAVLSKVTTFLLHYFHLHNSEFLKHLWQLHRVMLGSSMKFY